MLPLVYAELRKLAASKLRRELPGQTLQATALVHEAYLRLVDQDRVQEWDNVSHFFAAAAEAMRRILVERARRKRSAKHGGAHHRMELEDPEMIAPAHCEELLAVNEALSALATEDPEKAELVKLRYFAGLSIEDSARVLGISPATAKRRWAYARAYLFRKINGGSA
jgi:RNA polymerase sigma factor (TIGR02999 family)